jgi:hypothetical protein
MVRKLCNICNIRNQYTGPGDEPAPRLSEMCNPCYTEGGWENTHSDYDHEGDADDDEKAGCWICFPELNLAKTTTKKTGHKNTVAKTHTSHAGHGHPVTPAARAACRKFMAAHNGMDEVTYRVSVREAELDDAFEN